MVAARRAFLEGGHLEPLAARGGRALRRPRPDGRRSGCSSWAPAAGHQLARVLDLLPNRAGLALDSSKPALRRAARAHPRIGAVGCDAWSALPVRTGVAALALSVFAPRNGPELARVMAPGALLAVVTPTPRHLEQLTGPLGMLSVDSRKPERLERELGERLELQSSDEREWRMSLAAGELEALVMMGPSGFHVDPGELRGRIAALPERVEVSASVSVSLWRAP